MKLCRFGKLRDRKASKPPRTYLMFELRRNYKTFDHGATSCSPTRDGLPRLKRAERSVLHKSQILILVSHRKRCATFKANNKCTSWLLSSCASLGGNRVREGVPREKKTNVISIRMIVSVTFRALLRLKRPPERILNERPPHCGSEQP